MTTISVRFDQSRAYVAIHVKVGLKALSHIEVVVLPVCVCALTVNCDFKPAFSL